MAQKVSELLASMETELNNAATRIQNDVTNYEGRIAELQAKVDSGEALPADEATLERLKAIVAGIDPTNPDVLPGSVPTP